DPWLLSFVAGEPFVPAPLATETRQLDLRHAFLAPLVVCTFREYTTRLTALPLQVYILSRDIPESRSETWTEGHSEGWGLQRRGASPRRATCGSSLARAPQDEATGSIHGRANAPARTTRPPTFAASISGRSVSS